MIPILRISKNRYKNNFYLSRPRLTFLWFRECLQQLPLIFIQTLDIHIHLLDINIFWAIIYLDHFCLFEPYDANNINIIEMT